MTYTPTDYRDLVKSLSDKGLLEEAESSQGVDKIMCESEMLKRNISIPQSVWKYEESTVEPDHDYDLQEELHDREVDNQKFENDVINSFMQ